MTTDGKSGVRDALRRFAERVEKGEVEAKKPRKTRKKSEIPTEYAEQRDVCDWLDANNIKYFAVPNGGMLSGTGRERAIRWGMLARAGARAGVPDLVVLAQPPIGLEMKRREKSRLSEQQLAWAAILEAAGWRVLVGYGADDAIAKLSDIMHLRR